MPQGRGMQREGKGGVGEGEVGKEHPLRGKGEGGWGEELLEVGPGRETFGI